MPTSGRAVAGCGSANPHAHARSTTKQVPHVDTINPMVVPGPLGWEHLPPQRSRRWLWLLLPLVLVFLVLPGMQAITVPYFAIAPGSATPVNGLISAPKDKVFPPKGRVLLATVSLGRATALEAVQHWVGLAPNTDLVPEEQILGKTPPKRFNQENLQLMDDSKENAIEAALTRLGLKVGEEGKGALVLEVLPGKPGEGHLRPGDAIIAIDATPTTLLRNATEVLQSRKPGDQVDLTVVAPDGVTRHERLTLAAADDGRAIIGVTLRTKDRRPVLPFDVKIDSGAIGGPSAGLAFTLGLLDELSPGELTGGRKVAVTGTIDVDGKVGEVGGVPQKTEAVKRAGAKYFLVPPAELAAARSHAGPHLVVLPVSTLDEALGTLACVGGDVAPFGNVPKRTCGDK